MRPAAALALAAFLAAGCAGSADGTLRADGVEGGLGSEELEVACGDAAVLDAQVAGTGGALEATVLDGAGARVADKVTYAGQHEGSMDLAGAAGTWTLQLRQKGFSGDYAVALRC